MGSAKCRNPLGRQARVSSAQARGKRSCFAEYHQSRILSSTYIVHEESYLVHVETRLVHIRMDLVHEETSKICFNPQHILFRAYCDKMRVLKVRDIN